MANVLWQELIIENVNGKGTNLKTEVRRIQSMPNFLKNELEGKKHLLFGRFGVLCIYVTSVLRFALLPYYRRKAPHIFCATLAITQQDSLFIEQISSILTIYLGVKCCKSMSYIVIIFLFFIDGKINSLTHLQCCFLEFDSELRIIADGVAMFEDLCDYFYIFSYP